MILKLAEKDTHVKPVIFARNFGHQIAVTAGLDYACGDAVLIIDADLQDPSGSDAGSDREMERGLRSGLRRAAQAGRGVVVQTGHGLRFLPADLPHQPM